MPENEIVIHMDFAENYSCKTAAEIQSAYWNASQETLHPMVIYFRREKGSLEHKSYVAVSDILSHSSSTFRNCLTKKSVCLAVTKYNMFITGRTVHRPSIEIGIFSIQF